MRRIHNLDSFYVIIRKNLKFIEAYTGLKDLAKMITMCRLRPETAIKGGNLQELRIHKRWVDEWGNSLFIDKDRDLRIVINDPKIKKEKITTSDLYACLPLDKISKMSKLIYLLVGQDENYNDEAYVAFLGIDNFLRAYYYKDQYWKNISPLELGLWTLSSIAHHKMKRNFVRCRVKNHGNRPIYNQQRCLALWPPRGTTLNLVKQYPFLITALRIGE